MLKFLKKAIEAFGQWGIDRDLKRSDYVSKYSGQWVNKGTFIDEEWEWVEKSTSIRTYYVNVFQLERDFIITVGFSPRPNAIETIDCRDEREAEIAVDLLETYYGTLGNAIIDNEIQ